MLSVLNNTIYRRLFFSQLVALLGTGLATVALGLLAFDLAGESAALVLGTAFTIKMVAYVAVSPIAAALAHRFSRRAVLVTLNIARGAVAVCLPFVTEIWQIYVLIFLLQSASAGYTPAFNAIIPDVLKDERSYTNALSLSRLAMDAESLLSPLLAAVLLTFFSFSDLFWVTAFGFIASALFVLSVVLPGSGKVPERAFSDLMTRGISIYLKTPRLRGLLALNWVASSVGAMVIVNTVIMIRGNLALSENSVGIALAFFGLGSMLTAILLPKFLDQLGDRLVLLTGACTSIAALILLAFYVLTMGMTFGAILVGWFFLSVGYSAILTPAGRLLTRSAHREDRPAVFAAQFTLSHACWLVTYPLAGVLYTVSGAVFAMFGLAAFGAVGLVAAFFVWPSDEAEEFEHSHPELPPDHPHLKGDPIHKHRIIIDDLHRTYPE